MKFNKILVLTAATIIVSAGAARAEILRSPNSLQKYAADNSLVVENKNNPAALAHSPSTYAAGAAAPVPVPVPESSAYLAGAMLLIPFGLSVMRSLRKSRKA